MVNLQVSEENSQENLRIYCLGVFRIVKPREEVALGINSKHKMWLLLKYLIVKKGLLVPTEEVFASLWPAHRELTDTTVLRTTISRLKATLSLKQSAQGYFDRNSLIICRKDTCTLNTTYPYWLDVQEFEHLCQLAHRRGKSHRQEAIDIYISALELYQGDFLAEDSDLEWVVPVWEYYRRLFLDSVNELSEWLMGEGDFHQARQYLEKAIKLEPYSENLISKLIRLFCEMGNVVEAKSIYSYYSSLLYNDLGVKPSADLKEVYRKIVNQETAITSTALILKPGSKQIEFDYGSLVCDPDVFANLSKIEQRLASRGETACMIIVEPVSNEINNADLYHNCMQQVKQIIYQSLRKSDIVFWLDPCYLAVLLSATNEGDGKTVMAKLEKRFEGEYEWLRALIRFEIQQIGKN